MAATDLDDLLARARAGEDAAFAALVTAHERPVFRHCYRMLGSGPDAEDALQDTLERAWRKLATYDGSGSFGGWLHRIATNVCLDTLRTRRVRLVPAGSGPAAAPGSRPSPLDLDAVWVEPVSDSELSGAGDPQEALLRREEISLAFVAALQRLAPRQRAALLLHAVLGFSHAETAEVLAVSASAVNSLLSRARETVKASLGAPVPDLTDPRVQQFRERYVRAWQLADIEAFVQLVTEDVQFSMPPLSTWFDGREAVAQFVEGAIFAAARPHGVTLRAGSCNGQPAFATYEPDQAAEPGQAARLVVTGLQIVQLADVNGELLITALVSYRDPALAVRCGLPAIIGQPGNRPGRRSR
jgi:RNA polymerase sigma-70 factor (ECF subfamily)